MTIDLPTLLERATGGREFHREQVFRPSWFYQLADDPFWLWCEYHAPHEARQDDTSRYEQYLMQQGIDYEDRFVARHFPAAYCVSASWGLPALEETLAAMLRGEPAIHGGSLWLLPAEVYGKADLFVRCNDHPSDLGNYHYRVKEIKNASIVKPYHQLQAASYNWMLGELQGFCPDSFDIVLREGIHEAVIAHNSVAAELHLRLCQWRQIRDGKVIVQPLAFDTTASPWRKYANEIVRQRRDLTLLPGVGPATAAAWRCRGFQSFDDILAAGPVGCLGRLPNSDCYYHALAYQTGNPVFRPGESANIRRRNRQVYFDVEDTSVLDGGLVTRPHIYMIGVATPDGKTNIWTARGQDDEERMWSDFLNWLGDPSDVALYCWSAYEFGKLDQAVNDHSALASRLQAAKTALIDLKEEIKHRPYFPVPSYSIKAVAPLCGFHWSQDDVDGQCAQLMYLDWLQSGDNSIIEQVEQYNREDVLAMLAVDDFVSQLSRTLLIT